MGADGYGRGENRMAGAGPEESFVCPFCGGRGRIAVFCLDGDELYQALCDRCGTPSYFSESPQAALDAWCRVKP